MLEKEHASVAVPTLRLMCTFVGCPVCGGTSPVFVKLIVVVFVDIASIIFVNSAYVVYVTWGACKPVWSIKTVKDQQIPFLWTSL